VDQLTAKTHPDAERFTLCVRCVSPRPFDLFTGRTDDGEMKFGRIKRQHGRVGGLDKILDRVIKNCPYVTRIVPGRIKVRRGKTPPSFKIQYPTDAGLKCLYTGTGTVQEVFMICSDSESAKKWLIENDIVNDPS
jgi:Predicted metal-binding protein (DUF2103)